MSAWTVVARVTGVKDNLSSLLMRWTRKMVDKVVEDMRSP